MLLLNNIVSLSKIKSNYMGRKKRDTVKFSVSMLRTTVEKIGKKRLRVMLIEVAEVEITKHL